MAAGSHRSGVAQCREPGLLCAVSRRSEAVGGLRVRVPRADRAHAYLWLRLSHSGHADVQRAGGILDTLRRARNEADYDIDWPFAQATAGSHIQAAKVALPLFLAARQEPIKTQITDTIKVYERDVLRDVTWHP